VSICSFQEGQLARVQVPVVPKPGLLEPLLDQVSDPISWDHVYSVVVQNGTGEALGKDRKSFWERPQGAATFKHAVLDRYAPVFASKVGRSSPNHQVVILDGYAGRGWDEDGSPGSPALMVRTAETLARIRNVQCWFVEEDRQNYEDLSAGLADILTSGPPPRALHGTMSEHLPAVLSASKGIPMFVFIDPFGLGLPFGQLTEDVMGRGRRRSGINWSGPATEVLVNFVHAGIYRNAGMLSIDTENSAQLKAASVKVDDLDANLGGDWWQEIIQMATSTDEAVRLIRDGYVGRVLAGAGSGWRCFPVQVPDAPGGAVIYDLLFFTRHPHGFWFFNDAVSLARRVFQEHFDDARLNQQLSLWNPEDEWPSVIKDNLISLLKERRPVRVIDYCEAVYGPLLGIARGIHVKAAAKRLAEEGLNTGICTCDPDKLILVPPSSSRRPTQSAAPTWRP
jgi:three-Cys-motif partner protein